LGGSAAAAAKRGTPKQVTAAVKSAKDSVEMDMKASRTLCPLNRQRQPTRPWTISVADCGANQGRIVNRCKKPEGRAIIFLAGRRFEN
jgi:hypothetical protein